MIIFRLLHMMVGAAGLVTLGLTMVTAQDFPNKPIRIVTSEAGGSADFTARLIAQGMAGPLGRQVIVDNRGGSAAIAAEIVAKSQPDGYNLLYIGNLFWLLPLLQDKVPYDPVRDFSPITLAVTSPSVLVVHPSLPVKSVKELIALAKARPGELNYASGAIGSTVHLAAELFKAMAGVNILRIPYKGAGPALNDLIGGQVQIMFFSGGTAVMPHVTSGRLRALAVTSAQPSMLIPGLPTVAASGLPGYQAGTIYGVFAPAKTPPNIINRLNQEIVRVLNGEEAREKLFVTAQETIASSPEALAATLKSDIAKWGKVIKSANIRAD